MKLNYKRTIFVGFAFFLICAFWQAYDAIVPLMLVNKFGLDQSSSGAIMAIDNVLALFMLPLFGALSDKSTSKHGKRTPYIVIGTIVAIAAFISLSFADNSQLANMSVNEDPVVFQEMLFEDTQSSITNAEKPMFDDSVEKEYQLKDYASRILFNENYESLNLLEKQAVKEFYSQIGYESTYYYSSVDKIYYVDSLNPQEYHSLMFLKPYEELSDNQKLIVDELCEGKDGQYFLSGIANYDYKTAAQIKALDINDFNLYTNLVTPAISAYAWGKTVENPVPLVFFIMLLLVTLVAMAIFRSPAVALMPDVTIKPLRSQANAIINLMGTAGAMLVLVLGIVFGTGKVQNQTSSFTIYIAAVCAIMAIGLALFIALVREPKWAKEMQDESARLGLDTVSDEVEDASDGEVKSTDVGNNGGFKELFKSDRSKFNSLMLILASVALWYIGYNAASTKYSLYATNVLHKDFNTTLLIAQAAAIVAYLPAGALSKKIGRKNSILFGVAILTIAFFCITFFTDKTPLLFINLAFIVGGIGWATINVNSFPMVVEIAKGGNVGKYTGYYYTASMAAQIVTPILSGWIMELFGNMSPLFYYSTFFIGAAFITMMFVKHGDAKKEGELNSTKQQQIIK